MCFETRLKKGQIIFKSKINTYPLQEHISTHNNGIYTYPLQEHISTHNNGIYTYPLQEHISTHINGIYTPIRINGTMAYSEE